MIKLIAVCIVYSYIGKLLKIILRVSMIFRESINDYLSYCEAIWHYDCPKLFKTLYFNFRLCSFKEAVQCPIFIYGRTIIWSLKGNVVIEAEQIFPGMIKWGYNWGYRSNGVTIIRIEGDIIFKGECLIAKASDIAVFKGASITFGRGGKILENTIIFCANNIVIGNNFSFTFQCSMFDTDFHYIMDIANHRISRKSAPIFIGNNVWIGNRATIKKGVVIPDNTIIAASYTVLTKDYSSVPPYSILAGCPARVIASGYARIWKNEMINSYLIDKYFMDTKELFFNVEEDKLFDYIYECK